MRSNSSILTAAVMSFFAWSATARAQTVDLKQSRLVDLSHAYDAQTVNWPTSPTNFELKQVSRGQTEGGYFYAAYSLCTPEHGGTHLDAPFHFSETGLTTDRLPLTQLLAAAVVLDIRSQVAADRNYRLTRADVAAFEKAHGRIEPGTIVLLMTGWSRFWPNAKAYLGDDTPGDASKLSFPSYGEEAARMLVDERKVAALGIDTASIDYGPSADFRVHRIAGAANVPGLENLTSLEELPPRGAIVVALPMKIGGGSGGPLRAVALVPNR